MRGILKEINNFCKTFCFCFIKYGNSANTQVFNLFSTEQTLQLLLVCSIGKLHTYIQYKLAQGFRNEQMYYIIRQV